MDLSEDGIQFIKSIKQKKIGIRINSSFTIQKKLQLKSVSEKLLSDAHYFHLYLQHRFRTW